MQKNPVAPDYRGKKSVQQPREAGKVSANSDETWELFCSWWTDTDVCSSWEKHNIVQEPGLVSLQCFSQHMNTNTHTHARRNPSMFLHQFISFWRPCYEGDETNPAGAASISPTAQIVATAAGNTPRNEDEAGQANKKSKAAKVLEVEMKVVKNHRCQMLFIPLHTIYVLSIWTSISQFFMMCMPPFLALNRYAID